MANSFDDISLDDFLEWMDSGTGNIPPRLAEYGLMLERIWGMYRRHLDYPNEESIISHLVHVNKLQRYQARRLVKDAISYFSAEMQHSNQVWKNLIADMMKKNYIFAISVAKTAKDAKEANTILYQMAQILQLDKDEIGDMEEDLMKQIQILSTDIRMFGEEPENRNDLAAQIDALPDVPENVKERAKLEIDTFPFKLLKSYENKKSE